MPPYNPDKFAHRHVLIDVVGDVELPVPSLGWLKVKAPVTVSNELLLPTGVVVRFSPPPPRLLATRVFLMGEASFTERVLHAISKNRHLDQLTLKALMKATELLGLALGLRLASLRDSQFRLPTELDRVEVNDEDRAISIPASVVHEELIFAELCESLTFDPLKGNALQLLTPQSLVSLMTDQQ